MANVSSITSMSTALGTDNASNVYSRYSPYPTSSNPYGYVSVEYTSYYSGCQQQSAQPYTQASGAYQNPSSAYKSMSSFPNPGSYVGFTSYSSTY